MKRADATCLLIVDCHDYDGPMLTWYADRPLADLAYDEACRLYRDADVTLLPIARHSRALERRVAESVDQ